MRRAPEWRWAPLTGAALVLVIGCLGYLARMPWLIPSLGPTVFLQVMEPQLPSSQPYHILMGQVIGIVSSALVVGLFAVGAAPAGRGARRGGPGRGAAAAGAMA